MYDQRKENWVLSTSWEMVWWRMDEKTWRVHVVRNGEANGKWWGRQWAVPGISMEPSDEVAGCHHHATGSGCRWGMSQMWDICELEALDDCQSWRTSRVRICKIERYLQGVDSAKNKGKIWVYGWWLVVGQIGTCQIYDVMWSNMTKSGNSANENKWLSTGGTIFMFQSSCADKTPYLKVVGILCSRPWMCCSAMKRLVFTTTKTFRTSHPNRYNPTPTLHTHSHISHLYRSYTHTTYAFAHIPSLSIHHPQCVVCCSMSPSTWSLES